MFKKNTAVTGFAVGFIHATTGAAVTAGTPTGTFTLDGGAQTAIAGAFVHEGLGLWTVNLTAGEMNGTMVGLTFSLTDAINVYFTIKTVLYDPDNATTLGLANLDAAVSGRMATYVQPAGFLAATFPAGTVANTTNVTAATGIVLSGVTHTGAVIPTVTTLTGHTAQTGDNFARLGAPAGLSVSADVAAVKVDTAAVKTKTDFLPSVVAGGAGGVFIAGTNAATTITTSLTTTFTGNVTGSVGSVTGRVTANTDQINGVATAAARLALSTQGIVTGTVGAASTVTSVVTSALDPAAAVIDQYKGRIVTFKADTATVNLRGQSTDITTNTALGVLTVTALTTAPASGDTFTIT